jgi:hypothetical protein
MDPKIKDQRDGELSPHNQERGIPLVEMDPFAVKYTVRIAAHAARSYKTHQAM